MIMRGRIFVAGRVDGDAAVMTLPRAARENFICPTADWCIVTARQTIDDLIKSQKPREVHCLIYRVSALKHRKIFKNCSLKHHAALR